MPPFGVWTPISDILVLEKGMRFGITSVRICSEALMKNPIPGEEVEYTGGLFPELAEETWTVVLVFPGGHDIEVFGNRSYKILRKSRIDFNRLAG